MEAPGMSGQVRCAELTDSVNHVRGAVADSSTLGGDLFGEVIDVINADHGAYRFHPSAARSARPAARKLAKPSPRLIDVHVRQRRTRRRFEDLGRRQQAAVPDHVRARNHG